MIPEPFAYRANINPLSRWPDGVYDGDTVDLLIDKGFHDYTFRKVRLDGVDTPEMRIVTREQAHAARNLTVQWLKYACVGQTKWPLCLVSNELDAFGRIVGTIYRLVDGQNLTDYLRSKGYPDYKPD